MRHGTDVAGMLPSDLATVIGDLRYGALRDFLAVLNAKLTTDASADEGRGRPRLAGALRGVAGAATQASNHIALAWKIFEPLFRSTDQSPEQVS